MSKTNVLVLVREYSAKSYMISEAVDFFPKEFNMLNHFKSTVSEELCYRSFF